MFVKLGNLVKHAVQTYVQVLRKQLSALTKPTNTSVVHGCLRDLVRSKPQALLQ